MKTSRIFTLAILVFCSGLLVVRGDDSADRDALRLIRTNYMEAVNSGDLSKIKNDLSKEVTGVMVTGEPVEGYDDLVAYWKKIQTLIGPGGAYHVTVNVDKTDLFGDIAVSRGTTEESVQLPNGKKLDFSSSWTAVCHKENDAWKVLRMQATMNPIENVFISLQLQRAKLTYTAIGFIAGILIFAAARFVLCKRVQNKS